MKKSIITIKYILLLSVVFLLLTYSISLNDENKWMVLNTPWISHNFAFAIIGGVFASLLVILACEIQNYLIIKRQTEDYIYSQLYALYTQITIIYYNTKRQLYETNTPVPPNMIEGLADKGLVCLNNLTSVGYVTFGKGKTIEKQLFHYKVEYGMLIRSFLQNTIFLKMAINEDKIAMLRQGRDEFVKSSSPKTNLVLEKLNKESTEILTFIEESMETIDEECENRYHWDEVKRSIILGEENFVSADLDSFLRKQNEV